MTNGLVKTQVGNQSGAKSHLKINVFYLRINAKFFNNMNVRMKKRSWKRREVTRRGVQLWLMAAYGSAGLWMQPNTKPYIYLKHYEVFCDHMSQCIYYVAQDNTSSSRVSQSCQKVGLPCLAVIEKLVILKLHSKKPSIYIFSF